MLWLAVTLDRVPLGGSGPTSGLLLEATAGGGGPGAGTKTGVGAEVAAAAVRRVNLVTAVSLSQTAAARALSILISRLRRVSERA